MEYFKIGKSRIAGNGLFAQQAIKKGQVLFSVEGPVIKYEMESDYRIGQNWLQVRENIWQIPSRGHAWNYINHGCEPNCGMKRGNQVVAVRDIKKGEELTIDYSTVEGSRHWRMRCKCQSSTCRKVIQGIRFLPRVLFLLYKPFISPFLQKIYAQEKTYSTGRGNARRLFAKNPIEKGEEVFKVQGPIISYSLPPDAHIGYRWLTVGKNRWVIPSANNPWCFIRHSCVPNVGICDRNSVVAMKNIKPNEELTIDDSITEADIRWQRRCRCRSEHCRKIVRSVQFLAPALFQRYEPYMTKFLKSQYLLYQKKINKK